MSSSSPLSRSRQWRRSLAAAVAATPVLAAGFAVVQAPAQAVPTQLDLSLRTVQRRLRHLQDLSGVQSRMQLGWYAAKHDWA